MGKFFAEQAKCRLLAISLDSNGVPGGGFAKNCVEPEFHDASLKDPCGIDGAEAPIGCTDCLEQTVLAHHVFCNFVTLFGVKFSEIGFDVEA